MDYTIKAIPTKYKGILFRSRLEAKWAAMFDQLGWNWDYEPIDFNGWIPDFVIYGAHLIYVEVKPVIEFPEDVAEELTDSGCEDEMLIVGQRCVFNDDLVFGWMTEYDNDNYDEENELQNNWWDEAVLGKWTGSKKIGFCHAVGSFTDRISGGYDGGCYGSGRVSQDEIKRLWANAHNLTQWKKR